MAFARKVSWRDWFREIFVEQGLFSLRPMPTTRAEEAESRANSSQAHEITRLDLDTKSTPKD